MIQFFSLETIFFCAREKTKYYLIYVNRNFFQVNYIIYSCILFGEYQHFSFSINRGQHINEKKKEKQSKVENKSHAVIMYNNLIVQFIYVCMDLLFSSTKHRDDQHFNLTASFFRVLITCDVQDYSYESLEK